MARGRTLEDAALAVDYAILRLKYEDTLRKLKTMKADFDRLVVALENVIDASPEQAREIAREALGGKPNARG